MATAVAKSSPASRSPFHKASNQRLNAAIPSASRSPEQPVAATAESSNKTFSRLRSSLEQSLRTATRSKKTLPVDDFGTRSSTSTKGKEREDEPPHPPPKRNVLRRVAFRSREDGATPTSSPENSTSTPGSGKPTSRIAGFTSFITPSLRQASISSPALHLSSQGSSQAPPQPASASSPPPSNADVSSRHRSRKSSLQVGTPSKLGSKHEPKEKEKEKPDAAAASRSGPANPNANANAPSPSASPNPSATTSSNARHGHRSTKSYTPGLPPLPLTPTTRSRRDLDEDMEIPTPPLTPTPASRSTQRASSRQTESPTPARSPSTRTTPQQREQYPGLTSASTSHLPATSSSPISTPRRPSVADQHTSSSASRRVSDSRRGSASASPVPPPARVSFDNSTSNPRRTSIDAPSPSPVNPRRPSVDRSSGSGGSPVPIPNPRRASASRDSPSRLRGESPCDSPAPISISSSVPLSPTHIRPRAVSPTQRSYAQNRHFNISSGSLVLSTSPNASHAHLPLSPTAGSPSPPSSPTFASPPGSPTFGYTSNPDRDLIRHASSLICREVAKPPVHMARTEQGLRDWEEVEMRVRGLIRLERIWGRSGGRFGGSSSNVGAGMSNFSATNLSSSNLTSGGGGGEEREKRLFCEALKDGYVLCQLLNKLRSSSIVRPDPREDGLVRTSNITKFLAACASYGLANEDLFLRDDLMEATQESLARVARTVVRLVEFVDTPAPSRMILRGGVVRGEGKEGGGQMGIQTGSGPGPGEAHQGGPGQGNANGRAEAHQHQNPGRAEMTADTGASSSGSIMGLGGSPQSQPQTPSRSKSKSRRPSQSQSQSPYGNGTDSRATASASTPNLASPPASASASAAGLLHQGPLPPLPTSPSPLARSNSINPSSGGNGNGSGTGPSQSQSQSQMTPASPIRKRWSPPSGLPPVRSDSPDESASASGKAGGRGSPVVVRAVSVADRDRRGGVSPSPSPSPSPLRPALGQRPRTPLKPKDRSASGSGGSGSTSGLDTRERWRVLAAAAASASVDDDGDDTESMGMGMVMEVGADRDSPTGSGSGNDAEVKPLPVPQLMNPPPKSMMRKPSLKKLDNSGLFNWARSAASPGSNSGMRERRGSMKSREDDSARPPETPSKAGVGSKKTGKGHSANVDYDSDRNLSLRDSVGELPHLRRGGGGAHHGHSNSTGNLNLNLGMYSSSSNNSPYSPSHSNNPYGNNYPYRQSVASTAPSDADTTVTTAISSILDGGRSSSGGGGMFGTIRTMTTDLTSEAPSMSRTEGSFLAEEMARKRSIENGLGNGNGNASGWDRKLSVLDLSRVAEERETDESVSSKGHNGKDRARGRAAEKEKEKPAASSPAVHLRKGKWPDDFMDVFQNSSQAQPIPSKHSSIDYLDDRDSSRQSTPPISISPPRKLAIVGHRRSDGENSSGGAAGPAISGSPTSGLQFPRRPTHRPRHTIDTPVLLPKESLLRREASPDGSTSSSARVMLRRHSTKPNLVGVGRPHGYGRTSSSNLDEAPPTPTSDSASDRPAMVPFPRSASGEHGSPSPRSSGGEGMPRLRGRFQSEVDGASSRRRARPSSYDELGAKPPRSRIESMVNLGVASSGATSASDLLSRDSVDGSVVRMRLVVREDGKPPTHFQLGNCIGRGQFGSVYRALNLNTGQMVAVKRIRLEGLKEEEVTTLMREVDLVKRLSHPSIVKYEGMARDDDSLNIVLEYAENGSLGQILKAFGKLNERLVASYVVKILEGLHYLHTSDVVHCDLKAANILTTKNGNVKLSDFGVSLNLRAMEREIKDVAGTPNWMAPEVIELKGASTKADIWSLGCTVIELLTGRPPYAEISNTMSVMFRIVEDSMPPLPKECSELLENFLEQCFHKDPTKRPSAEELCEHPWLKNNWVALKDLRPQDSIPFLRRVSTDLQQKSDAMRYLSQLDIPETPISASPKDVGKISPIGRRTSASSVRPDGDFSPREHSFVKTTFSKPMICRVCLESVKKTAVLCSQCSLISHSKCAKNAPPTCDLRAQLLLYAQYAEKGNPMSAYSNPAEVVNDTHQNVAMSDVPFVEHSRTSLDMPRSPGLGAPIEHPPTAFKFMSAFKRSRTNLSPEPVSATGSSPPTPYKEKEHEPKILRKRTSTVQTRGERPLSVTSTSTGLSSLRSAATANESFSSPQNTGTRSQLSTGNARRPVSTSAVIDQARPNKATTASRPNVTNDHEDNRQPPGALPTDTRRHKKRAASSGNCTVQ